MIQAVGGTIRTSDAIKQGIHCRTLYALRDNGLLTQISRGIYRLAQLEPIANPDLVTVAARTPNAVVCLISALAFHNITTQIPRTVSIAIPKDAKPPRIDYPPITAHKFSNEAFNSGIEKHMLDGLSVKIYSAEKTLADCFKFRNKIGIDICIEALKLYKSRKKVQIEKIIKCADICRVKKLMMPYLETIII